MTTTFGLQIKEKREKLGWSQDQLAKAVKSHPHTISKIENGDIKFSRFLLPIQRVLGIVETPGGQLKDLEALDLAAIPAEQASLRCYYASAVEAEETTMFLRATPTTIVPRPARLRDFEEAYAVVVAIEAMAPAYNIGDTIYVNPYLPPEPGKDVLLRKEVGTGSMIILALLVEITRDGWLVRQHGGMRKKEFTVSRTEYPRCHRIIGRINR